jgi:hypothetical protein
LEVVVRVYVTAVPETDGVLTLAPAVTPVRVTPTTAGTADERVVTIADAVPTVMVLAGAVDALEGHTRMLVEGTATAMRRRVGVTTNVNVVALAAPEYVAENAPEFTELAIALNDPPVAVISAPLGVAPTNATGTLTADPEISVTPLATTPSVALVASTATTNGADRSVVGTPSGAVTTTANRNEPEGGAVAPSVYTPTDAECEAAVYVYVGVVPYVLPVATASTQLTAPVRISVVLVVVASNPVSASTIELVFPVPHTTEPAAVP